MIKREHEAADDSLAIYLDLDRPDDSYQAFARSFKADWPRTTRETQAQIVGEIIDAIMDALAGHRKLDVSAWSELARWSWDRLDLLQRRSVPMGFAWQQLSWSLDRIMFRGDLS